MKKNILFICKYNRFRSRIAEQIFNKLNKKRNIKSKSAGIIRGSPIDPVQRRICKQLGIKLEGKPQGISTKLLKWQNMIIVVADDVPINLFKDNKKYGKELEIWKIPDAVKNTKAEIIRIVEHIENRVKRLLRDVSR